MSTNNTKPLSATVNFATAGMGGLFGWFMVHPFNTLGIRMNLATATGGAQQLSFTKYLVTTIKNDGVKSLYSGLSAGLLRQLFYATSRFGLFEVFRDELAKHRETDFLSRLVCGVTSGGI
jgi:solute carrier family 25 oxoglutarate transporter 11